MQGSERGGSKLLQGKVTCRVPQVAICSVPPSCCCPGCVPLEAKSFQPFEFLAQTKGFAVSMFWGFFGFFSFPVAAVPLYGYGARENDHEYVERRVDFNSPLFKPETGFPFGKTLRDSLYVSLPWLDLLLGKRPSPRNLGEAPGVRCLGWEPCGGKSIGMLLESVCSRR